MNVLSTLLLACWLAGAGMTPDSELSGIYVNQQLPRCRIEFLADGQCYLSDALGSSSGTLEKEKDTFVCRRGEREWVRLHIEDGRLIDQDGSEWVRREEIAAMPWKDVRPVTLLVLDSRTHEPITEFSYNYRISTPEAEYDPMWVRPRDVRSDKGEITLAAPQTCRIEVMVRGEHLMGGGWRSLDLTSDNRLRRIEVFVSVYVTITGTVVDARTGKPIAGVSIIPFAYAHPMPVPDHNRTIKTDAEGKFTLHNLDHFLGFDVKHPDYFDLGSNGSKKTEKKIDDYHYSVQIRLTTGERLFGVVKDTAGRPLAGVLVSDGSGKELLTGEDGSFSMAGLRKSGIPRAYSLHFKKEGYLDQSLAPQSANPRGFSVGLEPIPVLAGQVLDPQGQPVTAFSAAVGKDREPESWGCSSKQVRDPEGRFSIPVCTDRSLRHTDEVWIGVKSEGFALWGAVIPIDDISRPITTRLTPGVTVHGSVTRPEGHTGAISATLLPVPREKVSSSLRQEFGQINTTVDADGEFRLPHVAPGQYMLRIAWPTVPTSDIAMVVPDSDHSFMTNARPGLGSIAVPARDRSADSDLDIGTLLPPGAGSSTGLTISPRRETVFVSDTDFDAGTLALPGTGSVAGVVYENETGLGRSDIPLAENRRPWAFASGRIVFHDNGDESEPGGRIRFEADEHGRFRVDGVPVGFVSVEFLYRFTPDVIGAYKRNAFVVEGETTEVRFFDTSGQWDVVCKFQVGDGSARQFSTATGMGAGRKVENMTTRAPMFQFQLRPVDQVPISYVAADWNVLDSDNEITLHDVPPGKYHIMVNDWMTLRGLDACVYEATVEANEGETTWTIPLGAGSITGRTQWSKDYRDRIHVFAVGKQTGIIRHAYCDERGNFCVRYLPQDDYTLWARDDDAGWCAMPTVAVRNNIRDMGVRRLATGGTITGKVPPEWQRDPEVAVVAVDSHGIAIEAPHGREPIDERFAIANLWSDTWTIRVLRADQVITKKTVVLQGRETVTCDIEGRQTSRGTLKPP